MRVISGAMRGCKLTSLEGDNTRPTTDRIKETVFNMISFDIDDGNVLDFFAGSGGIGIEFLSRGAKHCTFVDNNKDAINVIKQNLDRTRFSDKSTVICSEFNTFKNNGTKYDILYLDPPYNKNLHNDALKYAIHNNLLEENCLIIVECSSGDDVDNELVEYLELYKQRKFKTTNINIYRLRSN